MVNLVRAMIGQFICNNSFLIIRFTNILYKKRIALLDTNVTKLTKLIHLKNDITTGHNERCSSSFIHIQYDEA
ncbi:unnamed protein product [Schistosoma mattheei]|uniref:Uncharacterized protein n=1 Tax=Schistosoma mattheei TaxID=31246 RepID=A0AA85BTJ8_9TREM|nr:unnamed protein product [Schistosoma mattheei]